MSTEPASRTSRGRTCRSWLGMLLAFVAPTPTFATSYQYDKLNRLTRVVYDNGSTIVYSYDAVGNRTARMMNPSAATVCLTIIVDPVGGGSVGRSPNISCFASGTPMELLATAAGNCSFVQWTGDVPAGHEFDNPLVVGPTDYATIRARFGGFWQASTSDCNSNGVFDGCEARTDCNQNLVLDSCDVMGGTSRDCNLNSIPDECDIASGTSTDANGNGTPDVCEPGMVVWDPATIPGPWPNNNPEATTRSLWFTVTGTASPTMVDALKVTMVDLQHPNPRNSPTNPPANYTTFDTRSNGVCSGGQYNGHHCDLTADCTGTTNGTCAPLATCTAAGEMNGCSRWVGKPGTFYESEGPPQSGPYRAARLQCTPFYWDWKSEGMITAVGAEIVPSSEYSVQAYATSCMGSESTCTNVSSPVTMYTRRLGDVDSPYNPGSMPITNQPNATDIAQLVNKFKNSAGAPVHARAQLQPNLPELNASINALDIVAVVDAFKGLAYAFSGPCPCPSTQTCGLPCMGCAGMCVKTCVGGDNAGDPCISDTHCPGGTCGNPLCRDKCGRCTP